MSDGDDRIKQIPYGISDYELIRKENYYYVDKTRYLETIKNAGRYLFLIRPRRFGKSLFLSMMEAYYDVTLKDRFEELFKGTWIFDHPTDDRGGYLVLKFNFSLVAPAIDKVEASFFEHVRGVAFSFISKYENYLLKDKKRYMESIENSPSASDTLSVLIRLSRDSKRKLYVIIDEYDNFANTILSTSGKDAYEKLTHGAGSFRAFFNVLKGGTDGAGAPFSRLFFTGVSPVTLDDVTSGYNIGENITMDNAFHRIMGFTDGDVKDLLHYYRSNEMISHDPGDLLEIIRKWYGNYLFSEYADPADRLHNSDMVLYFLKQYFKNQTIPRDLIDRNVRMDYGKLRHLIIVDKERSTATNGNFSRLKEIIETGGTTAELEKGFPLEKISDPKHFISLLFYFGLLTIGKVDRDIPYLTIPNETVKRLYYDYITEAYRETGTFDLNLSKYSDLMRDMAYEGKWKPLLEFITGRMKESMSLRDLITGEKSIQAFLNVYLGLGNFYIIHTEKEMNKGFADIVMEPFLARYQSINYSYLLEIKYLKATDKQINPDNPKVLRLKTEAEAQVKNYAIDKTFGKVIAKTSLVKLVLVFSGHELIYMGEA